MSQKSKNNLTEPERTGRQIVKLETDGRAPKKKSAEKPVREESLPRSSALIHQFMPFILWVVTLFLTVCFIFSGADGAVGSFGRVLRNFFCGLFGWTAFLIPLVLVNLAIYWRKYIELDKLGWKLLLGFACMLTVSGLVHSVYVTSAWPAETPYTMEAWSKTVFGTDGAASNWAQGIALHGGGFFGGLLGGILRALCGYIGAPILLVGLLCLSAMFYFSVTPGYVWNALCRFSVKVEEKREKRKAAAEQKERKKAAEAAERLERQKREEEQKRKEEREREKAAHTDTRDIPASVRDIPFGPAEEPREPAPQEPARPAVKPVPVPDLPAPSFGKERPREKTASEIIQEVFFGQNTAPESPAGGAEPQAPAASPRKTEVSVTPEPSAALPAGDTVLTLRKITGEAPAMEEDSAPESDTDSAHREREQLDAYFFPPLDLLHEPQNSSKDDISAELRTNAQKIMDKLDAFNVKIRKIDYSRGPSITRFELYPDASTRVRSIASLQDDIALELAATIRMGAPIPNKNAVGIEVPNQIREIVSIREMLGTEKFRSLGSRLSACLGKDVGGNMVFFDIAKMPHLLIAGTTGSGKSVCLNTIILSILYKARPDEVKFIMIDPKKIEMGLYNGLPHMKVPVVSDMKRAAGTLSAAVNEMEHRYTLFEETCSRDLDGYNRLMADADPFFTPLPRIVIIIDELADLMMTAPQDIEASIIRLAQKARAAGIHLIVGTQRPSANVITGLIKANIPSRIAFTVVSNTDSRIIIDMPGAEKLIGKGDMLYSPTGSLKPFRLQGAFVADDEVRAVTDFIRENSPKVKYDSDFISEIDRETERMEAENHHGKSQDEDSEIGEFSQEADPLFNKALHIAVENGTVATSLLQRKLSVGFGRAAKIIDRMEALGFVSKANGTKPRSVLIDIRRLNELEMDHDPTTQGRFN